ncbi:hermansky-pudlak syndrome protein 1 [Holotrichia oblita]|uniref:Hermansky-pudlak syndrome protein 1 n=1 Tax=Holotrichia oblita TaxID=644536 RepID=A0ACB9SVZ4_HOLOL|nr:hermansky-pudlak syndrome protein 1 [Holotrichia oblita]
MKCILIFDYTNDIIYTKYNKKFALHINEFAKSEGLIPEEQNTSSKLSANVLVQIFSPIVTSQRIMSCQFGNSYTSIQCEDGLNISFQEYMGYLFLSVGNDDIPSMKRFLSICVMIIRYICGPNVLELKFNTNKSSLITHLIDCWTNLKNNDQGMFIEAIEQIILNQDLTTSTVQGLREAVEKMQHLTDCMKIHGLLLAQNKFLGLYSSQNAKVLSCTDTLFSILLSESTKMIMSTKSEVEPDSEDEFYSPSSTPDDNIQVIAAESHENYIYSYQILLSGNDYIPKCIPHVLHICPITEGINLLLFIEIGNISVSSNLYESFLYLHNLQSVQIQRDVETLRPVFENLDSSIKKLCDALKKSKNNMIETVLKQLNKHWDFMRKKYQEFIKIQSAEALLRVESMTAGLLDIFREILKITAYDEEVMKSTQGAANECSKIVTEKLVLFEDFLKVKAMKHFSLGSYPFLYIQYLEEFPGLVHFIYIDRTNHRITAPSLDFNADETLALTKQKIWSMINFSRTHLEEGHLSIIWKDTTFSYAYFLWFEDTSGSAVKPTIFPTHASKPLPQPGILSGDFYEKLKEMCFPKISPNKIRCYELYCVHLGLATAQCVLEHTRRIAATIWEIKGQPDHPIDLL